MSSINIAGDTSGTITIEAPDIAGATVLTLPSTNGTVLTSASTTMPVGSVNQAAIGTNVSGTGPLFRAYAGGAQTVSSATYTKATLVEEFDTNSNFASSRFTPTVAGYYQINTVVVVTASSSITSVSSAIYKNGLFYSFATGTDYLATAAAAAYSDTVYCNGTTDYVELYVRPVGTGTLTVNSGTTISGALVRAA
jgi:hypothetical protein